MWVWLALLSSILLGLYDVAKKQSLKRNGAYEVLLCSTILSALFLCPFLRFGPVADHLSLLLKAVLVTTSWVTGMLALKLIPITTLSTIKATRPVFVLLFSIILFGERLNAWQWAGSIVVIAALFLLSRTSRKEGVSFAHNKGIAYMAIAVLTGVASALYDKHILKSLEPVFVQSWTNVYIAVLMGLLVLWKYFSSKTEEEKPRFKWDWMIIIISVLITIADFLYFTSLKCDGAMLSVISMVRRASVVVPFVFGIFLYKEKQAAAKSVIMLLMLSGIALMIFGS